jgi:PAS domain-containing protein
MNINDETNGLPPSQNHPDIHWDISSHNKNEIALLEQRNFIDSVVRNSTVAMFALDFNHNVHLWNKACENLTGSLEGVL